MTITRKHLAVFDLYEGKVESLNRIGTKEVKLLFQEGEFEKISDLIKKNYLLRTKKVKGSEADNYEIEINALVQVRWNKKRIEYLSKKYCGPKKEKSLFNNIMDILWAAFG